MVRFLRSREVTHIVRWVSDAETCDACVGDRWRCCDTTGFVRVRVLGFEDYDSFGDVWTALSRTRQTQKLVTPALLRVTEELSEHHVPMIQQKLLPSDAEDAVELSNLKRVRLFTVEALIEPIADASLDTLMTSAASSRCRCHTAEWCPAHDRVRAADDCTWSPKGDVFITGPYETQLARPLKKADGSWAHDDHGHYLITNGEEKLMGCSARSLILGVRHAARTTRCLAASTALVVAFAQHMSHIVESQKIRAAKVVFCQRDNAGNVYCWSHGRRRHGSIDVLGGFLEAGESPSAAAMRELSEEAVLPLAWTAAVQQQLNANPSGHIQVIKRRNTGEHHEVHVWVVALEPSDASITPVFTAEGRREARAHSDGWRSSSVLSRELLYAEAFKKALQAVPTSSWTARAALASTNVCSVNVVSEHVRIHDTAVLLLTSFDSKKQRRVLVLASPDGRCTLPHAQMVHGADSVLVFCDMAHRLVDRSNRVALRLQASDVHIGSTDNTCVLMRAARISGNAFPVDRSTWMWVDAREVPNVCDLDVATSQAYRSQSAAWSRQHEQELSLSARKRSAKAPDVTPPTSATTSTSVVGCSPSTHIASVQPGADKLLPPGEDSTLLERVSQRARSIALSRGSFTVTARDISMAAMAENDGDNDGVPARPSPAEVLPVHYDSLVDMLASMATSALSRGGRQPRVLIAGERTGVVASMFALAGADVATADFNPTETPNIPHYQGDVSDIIDSGFDLVIAHPSCTYLSNAGIAWLYRDPGRIDAMVDSAWQFRRMRDAKAPFVAVEQPVMHRYARILTGGHSPDQYVHPWQHGVGHTKPTGLHLKNLPLIRPTCVVEGREHAMANVSQSRDRGDVRSRTYHGIAAAMALQWMPTLYQYCRKDRSAEGPSAQEIVDATRRHGVIAHDVRVAFCRSDEEDTVCWTHHNLDQWYYGDGQQPELLGTQSQHELGDCTREFLALALHQAVNERVNLHATWRDALFRATRCEPHGHAAITHVRDGVPRCTHVWVVYLTAEESLHVPTPSLQESVALRESNWTPATQLVSNLGYGDALARALVMSAHDSQVLHVRQSIALRLRDLEHRDNDDYKVAAVLPSLPSTFTPWFQVRQPTRRKTPLVKQIRNRRGVWRAWTVDNRGHGQWLPLQAQMSSMLHQAYGEVMPDRHVLEPHLPLTSIPELPGPNEVDGQAPPCPLARNAPGLTSICAVQPGKTDLISQEVKERRADRAASQQSGNHAMLTAQHEGSWQSLRKLWSSVAPSSSNKQEHRGLGSDDTTPRRVPLPRAPVNDYQRRLRIELHRASHQNWARPSAVNTKRIVALTSFADPTTTSPGHVEDETSPALDSTHIARPSVDPSCKPSCLLVKGVTVCIREKSRTRHSPAEQFRVNSAAIVQNSLSDSGAAPSVVTTDLLSELPADACIRRNLDSLSEAVNGPDGRPLTTRGTVTIIFAINGRVFEHEFLVVEGAPLLILGNDFHVAHAARITFPDGQREGTLELTSSINEELPTTHVVSVTCGPTGQAAVAAIQPTGLVASVQPTPQDTSTTLPRDETAHTLPDPPTPPVAMDNAVEMALRREHDQHLLYTEKAVVLPPRSHATVWLRAPLHMATKKATFVVDRIPHRPGLEEGPHPAPAVETRLVSIDEDGKVPVTLWNLAESQVVIPAFSPAAHLDSEYFVHVPKQENEAKTLGEESLTEDERKLIDSVVVDPDGRLNDTQRKLVRKMLVRHIRAFAMDPKKPTHTHLMDVELELKEGVAPHRHAAARLGPEGEKLVEKHVEEMESRNIIRKSNSPWASRVVIVSKKDGSTRFCIDYRDLNSKLKIQDSPIPFTVSALDKMMSGTGRLDSLFLSTLDLASGFWTLPVKESDKPLLAFVTHRQKYEFNYLPFGVQSGPSYMCRLIDAALQGLAWDVCIPYLDDVGLWSSGVGTTLEEREENSFQQMLDRMDMVLERLRWAGLSCKASKCVLFATSTAYLGHVVSRQGLKMDPDKVEKVQNIDTKTVNTLEKVRSFLGLCSYYRRFIKGFAKIAGPLHELTQVGVDVAVASQSEECQSAMRALIKSITDEPVMAPPRFDREFILKTDAANTEGLGGVLSQVDDEGHERVIAYYGRSLRKAEKNYTVTEIELLAALESIKHWRPYLWGRQFRLVIDHVALKWLHTMKDTVEGGPASRLMRWILTLSEYRFTVEHKPGATHKDADAISRLVAAVLTARKLQSKQREERNAEVTRPSVVASYLEQAAPNQEELLDAQKSCPFCSAAYALLVTGYAPHITDQSTLLAAGKLMREARKFIVVNDILFKESPAPGTVSGRKLRYVIPEPMRRELVVASHDRMGHLGATRVFQLLSQQYYWPNMQADVDRYIEECHECTLSKSPPRSTKVPKGPPIGSYPFDLLYCDILSMAPTHDYVKGEKGYDKLLVFVDSLTRWVEAIPFNGDPTSEQVLDAFMTEVVCRHGAPRQIRSDAGTNVSSQLCDYIMETVNVDLSPSTAEHHESVGMVERFNQTLAGMTRATDEGGDHWVDHLPFLLFAFRATTQRTTQHTPASLLYGRELRSPSQMELDPSPSAEEHINLDGDAPSEAARQYALRLHNRLALAWRMAAEVSTAQVVSEVGETERRSHGHRYEVNDRVCRLLHDHANKLFYRYAGPYRVKEVTAEGRYILTDLENNILRDEFDSINLRPYRAKVDAEELQPDEYVVDELIGKRKHRGVVQYLVKWRQYPRSQATWEPERELSRRCADYIEAYNAAHAPPQEVELPSSLHARRKQRIERQLEDPVDDSTAPTSGARSTPTNVSDSEPSHARYERGKWFYGIWQATPRGRRLRIFPAKHFEASGSDPTLLRRLRQEARANSVDGNVPSEDHEE